jgi:hypothetical protein
MFGSFLPPSPRPLPYSLPPHPLTTRQKNYFALISDFTTLLFLAICKGPNKWRLVQGLQFISEAVIPLHPIVPNPYTLLVQIPSKAQYYSVLDIKDTFFCIPLHPDSQPLFCFDDLTNPSQQLTWTVLPQGFRDSPHLFGQALTRALLDCISQRPPFFNKLMTYSCAEP